MSYIKRRSNETNDLQQELPDVVKDVVKELTKRQVAILDMILNNPLLSAKAISEKISEKFAVTDKTIENDLAHLKKIGILTREGGRKDGRWVVNIAIGIGRII